MLQGTGNGSFIWSPQSDLSNSNMANPTFLATTDRQFILKIITPEGCEQTDTVNIKVYDGPAIYVPNAFTPNNDGKNDLLKPYYVGIKALKYFSIYNRWGQLIFKTGDITKGWDGREAITGTYVWLIEAVNDQNKTIILKGTTTIIR
jgi:gliding motility-associated-like protein